MFESGTKVILVESSLQKTIGPRKGSIGYVSNCTNTRIVPVTTEGFGSFSVVASLCDVIFIRFGFEEHGRMERKSVISIFPLIKNGRLFNGKDNKKEIDKKSTIGIDKHIKDLCSMISSQKDSYLWEGIRDACDVSSNVPIALVTPLNYDVTNLTTCENIEFKAWVTSYLSSIYVANFVNSTVQSRHFTNYNDVELKKSETWDYLHILTSDRGFRTDYIRNHYAGIDERKECILLIRRIISTLSHTRLKGIRRVIGDIPSMATFDFVACCYDTVGPYLYDKVAIALLYQVLRDYPNNPGMVMVAEDIINTITECLSLSDDMLRSNNGFGYKTLNSK